MAGRSNPNPSASGDDPKSRPSGSQDMPAETGSAEPGSTDESKSASMAAEATQQPGRPAREEGPADRGQRTGRRRYEDRDERRDERDEEEVDGLWATDTLADNVGSVATAAAVVVGAALIEAELIPGIAVGAGAVLLGMMFPQVRRAVRPVLKTAVRAGLAATDKAREMAAEAGEQVQDVMAEVRAEREQRSMHSRRQAPRSERAARDDRDLGDAIPA